MTSPRLLSNKVLIEKIKALKSQEDRLLVELLEHIQVFEQRRLHLELGFPSLYAYLTKELGYSEAEAYRRIEAARFMKDSPEIRPMISDGSLSLTAVAEVRTAIRAQERAGQRKFSSQDRLNLAKAVTNCTKREAQKAIVAILPDFRPTQYERKEELVDGGLQVTFRLDALQRNKADRTRDIYARRSPVTSTAGLFEGLCDFFLRKNDHENKSTRSFGSGTEAVRNSTISTTSNDRRYIPENIKREVFKRDKSRCQFPRESGGICGSTYDVHVDHIIPISKGGKSVLENLWCMCRSHNHYKSDQTRWSPSSNGEDKS